jgi:hypothetical protein
LRKCMIGSNHGKQQDGQTDSTAYSTHHLSLSEIKNA